MIPSPHRTKGGAPMLGTGPGGVGPFGPYGADTAGDADEDRDPDNPTGDGEEHPTENRR
ncbi:hypothetical protein ACWEQ3_48900 [Streptomyces mirabilis]